MSAELETIQLTKRFGGVVANSEVDLHVHSGEIVGLIGPNGAGKSTLFNCIAGFFPPTSGKVIYQGREIQGLPPYDVCNLGIARTFQIPKTFLDMTVIDNVMVGALRKTSNVPAARRHAEGVLALCGLDHKTSLTARGLTIADRKRLELARALSTDPTLLMLDEVMAGLTPVEQQEAVSLVHKIHDQGVTILLVEHVMEIVMPISDRVVVLDQGVKIAEDIPANIVQNPRVIEAYLGETYHVEN